MTWYAWALVAYIAFDRLYTVAICGRGKRIDITPAFAVASLITGSLIVWAVVSLAGA